jgi:hypothetical protein
VTQSPKGCFDHTLRSLNDRKIKTRLNLFGFFFETADLDVFKQAALPPALLLGLGKEYGPTFNFILLYKNPFVSAPPP